MSNSGHLPKWTAERIELLTRMWNEGFYAQDISIALKGEFSRMAVIGKAYRLGLQSHASLRLQPRNPGHPGKVKPERKPAQKKRTFVLRRQPHVPISDCPSGELIGLMALSDETCRYPVGDPHVDGFGFCGLSTVSGSPYCNEHEQLTRLPVGPVRINRGGGGAYLKPRAKVFRQLRWSIEE